jgi:hypothetical protein
MAARAFAPADARVSYSTVARAELFAGRASEDGAAATALRHELELLPRNARDFASVPGLRLHPVNR